MNNVSCRRDRSTVKSGVKHHSVYQAPCGYTISGYRELLHKQGNKISSSKDIVGCI